MKIDRYLAAAVIGSALAATPASAQFFLQNPDYSGAPVRGDEPGVMNPLPGATPDELRAGLVWTLRAGLNFAALQCQFDPTLLTRPNYNALLIDHKDELKSSFDTLTKYFARVAKTKKAGQSSLDQFNTRVYSSFSTVRAQYNFCQTASQVGRDALYARRGELASIAQGRMREMRNALTPRGEQRFPGRNAMIAFTLPRLEPRCWTKKNVWNTKACGAQPAWYRPVS